MGDGQPNGERLAVLETKVEALIRQMEENTSAIKSIQTWQAKVIALATAGGIIAQFVIQWFFKK